MKFCKDDLRVLDRVIDEIKGELSVNGYSYGGLCSRIERKAAHPDQWRRLWNLLNRLFEPTPSAFYWNRWDCKNRLLALSSMKRAVARILKGEINYNDLPKSTRRTKDCPTNFDIPTKSKRK